VTTHRPIGITILAALAAVATVIAGIHTLQYLHLFPIVIGPVSFFGFDLWGALLWGLMTFIYAWVVYQLWTVNPQGWSFLVILAVLNISLDVISAIGQTSLAVLMPSIIFNAIVLLYCLTSGVKRAFGQEAPRPV
jgi:hypothetical protein